VTRRTLIIYLCRYISMYLSIYICIYHKKTCKTTFKPTFLCYLWMSEACKTSWAQNSFCHWLKRNKGDIFPRNCINYSTETRYVLTVRLNNSVYLLITSFNINLMGGTRCHLVLKRDKFIFFLLGNIFISNVNVHMYMYRTNYTTFLFT
jgi:hypothetical protein